MAVSRGPLTARDFREYEKNKSTGTGTSGSNTAGGGRGTTPNCGPNSRWNGTRCVSTKTPTSGPLTSAQRGEQGINAGEMARKAQWDAMTPQQQADALSKVDYNALGRLMGIKPSGSSGAGGGKTSVVGAGVSTAPTAPTAPAGTKTPTDKVATGETPSGAMTQDEITKQLLEALGGIEAFAKSDINAAGDALLKSLGAYDPQAQFSLAQPSVGVPAANLGGYLGYIGGSPAQVEGAQQYAQGLTDAFLGDVNRYQTGSAQAQDVFRGRQMDIARQNQAKALMQLALNTMAARLGIRTGEATRRQNQLDTALQLALQYGRPTGQGTGNLGITAPNIRYQTVTLPNGQMVQLPSTLFGGF